MYKLVFGVSLFLNSYFSSVDNINVEYWVIFIPNVEYSFYMQYVRLL